MLAFSAGSAELRDKTSILFAYDGLAAVRRCTCGWKRCGTFIMKDMNGRGTHKGVLTVHMYYDCGVCGLTFCVLILVKRRTTLMCALYLLSPRAEQPVQHWFAVS